MNSVLFGRMGLRCGAFILGILALIALFQKLPTLPTALKICTTCTSQGSYLIYLGIGYFALLTTTSLLFPAFPNRLTTQLGFIWATLLALTLTSIHFPHWCMMCCISHFCHISMWVIWWFSTPIKQPLSLRLGLALVVPLSIVLFASHLKTPENTPMFTTGLRQGEPMPTTSNLHTDSAKGIVINFISEDCPFCKRQIPIVNTVAKQLERDSYRFIHIAPNLTDEFIEQAPDVEWIEDREGFLHQEFQILAHPTLFVIDSEGKIAKIISGIPKQLEEAVFSTLK